MSDLSGAQRDIARIALDASRDSGFVVVGKEDLRGESSVHVCVSGLGVKSLVKAQMPLTIRGIRQCPREDLNLHPLYED